MYDFIGDIHGQNLKLEELLKKLDYKKNKGVYFHPTRKAFFLGDFIDRGPGIKETLAIVRPMIEQGYAKAVMGNHEYNFIGFYHKGINGDYLRPHTDVNKKQVIETQNQLSPAEVEDTIKWFLSLPLFVEEEKVRAVHACWNNAGIMKLLEYTNNGIVTLETMIQNFHKGHEFYDAIELVLKGPEIDLQGKTFIDNEGHVRTRKRVLWWETYAADAKPVFFGHYWMNGDRPYIMQKNAQCLDFSVALDGLLVAYRFEGESELSESQFFYV